MKPARGNPDSSRQFSANRRGGRAPRLAELPQHRIPAHRLHLHSCLMVRNIHARRRRCGRIPADVCVLRNQRQRIDAPRNRLHRAGSRIAVSLTQNPLCAPTPFCQTPPQGLPSAAVISIEGLCKPPAECCTLPLITHATPLCAVMRDVCVKGALRYESSSL